MKKPTRTDVNRYLGRLSEITEHYTIVDRPCQKGDRVTFEHEMLVGGVVRASSHIITVILERQPREMMRAAAGLRAGERGSFIIGPVEHRVRITKVEERAKLEGEALAHQLAVSTPAELERRVKSMLFDGALMDEAAKVVEGTRLNGA